MMTLPDPDVCARLQERLRNAESLTREILRQTGDHHPLADATRELLDAHGEIRRLFSEGLAANGGGREDAQDPALVSAAIELNRREHEMKADVVDIIKALFMWRDDPADHAGTRG